MQDTSAIIRETVRDYLADRPSTAHPVTAIHRVVAREAQCSEQDILDALSFLLSLSPAQATTITEPLGSRKYYQITAAGTLARERGQ